MSAPLCAPLQLRARVSLPTRTAAGSCWTATWSGVSRRELADFAGLSRGGLARTLQKLTVRGLIRVEEQREKRSSADQQDAARTEKLLCVTFLPSAQPILAETISAQSDFDQTRFAGFSQEELGQYAALSEKIRDNMRRVLQ